MKTMKRKDENSRLVDQIDQNLKQAFDSVASEPVPDRFTDLLAQLRAKETAQKEGGEDA